MTTIVSLPNFDFSKVKFPSVVDLQGLDRMPPSSDIKADTKFEFPNLQNVTRSRRRAVTIPEAKSTLSLEILDSEGEMTPPIVKRNVRFSSHMPEIDFVPNDWTARTSRAGSWGVAPFHDEIWDGERGDFREYPISEDELRQENLRHAILSFVSQTVDQLKTMFGLSLKEREMFIKNNKEEIITPNECMSDVERLMGGMYNSFLRLIR